MIVIPDRNINALAIGGGAPLDASKRTAWPNRCAPNDAAVIGIERPKDAAFLAKADNIAYKIRPCSSEIEIRAAGYRTVRLWSCGSKACYRPSIKALQPLRPLDLPGL